MNVLWMSSNFTEQRRRSWPHGSTPLEVLATRAGITDEELRDLLRAEIDRRARARSARHALAHRRLDARMERVVAQAGDGPEAPPVHH